MMSGWFFKWPLNRPLTQQEKDDKLPRAPISGIEPDDRGALLRFNSTFVEIVDRRFRLRGGGTMTLPLILEVASVIFGISVWFWPTPKTQEYLIGNLIIFGVTLGSAYFMWWMGNGRDFFTSTYYPTRFNRKTRQVYVYRDKRDGGILTMPWEQGYFHIGQGLRDKRLLDLRCHILDGETVKDTFPVGEFYTQKEVVQQVWEFVRTYMDEGVEAAKDCVIAIGASPSGNWRNCFNMSAAGMGAGRPLSIALLSPFIGLTTLTRWLVMKSCKTPQWPAEIEVACRIEPDDPNQLPEPAYTGQFSEDPEVYARIAAKYRKNVK